MIVYNIISVALKKLLGLALYCHAWYGKTENLLLQGKLALESYINWKNERFSSVKSLMWLPQMSEEVLNLLVFGSVKNKKFWNL